MTPQQEPEHCAIEKICRLYHHRTYEYNKDLSCGMTCEHDTRSRPAPLTQNDNGDRLIICRHCGKVTQVQCNEAAQAHKDVLDKLREWSIVQYEISGVIDTMTLKQKIESLRTGGERR